MRIDRLVLHRVRVPMLEPFRISNSAVDEKEAVIVEVHEGDLIGYGEASPMAGSFYSSQTPESTWRALCNDLAPPLLASRGKPFAGRLASLADSDAAAAEPFAGAGLENALWDLEARRRRKPLWALLGGRDRPVASGLAVGLYDTIEELIARIREFLICGYQRIKIKITHGWDIAPLEAVRREFPHTPLMVDANAAYGAADLPLIRELDRFGLMMIEQPFGRDELELSSEAQKGMRTPICADESAESLDALRRIIKLGSARIINIKIQRVGGLAAARAMHDAAAEAGLRCWVGTMPELGIASAHGLHLATLSNFTLPSDIEASARWYRHDIIHPPIELSSGGCIRIPAGPGIGYAPDFARFVSQTAVF
jgi:O-succinylbenzoate synthase